jgi:hypothetical protein
MNQMALGTSAIVRPSDVSDSRDDRELGLAVSAIRLTLTATAKGTDPRAWDTKVRAQDPRRCSAAVARG